MKIVCVLLARIGSKRIPKKLLAPLGDRPLVDYTLSAMAMLPYPSYVFSDSPEIQELTKYYGLEARDKILENSKGIHFTSQELKEYNKEMMADIIVLFQATSPFRDIDSVKSWIEQFPYQGVNCAFTVRPIKLNLYSKDGTRVWPTNRNYDNKNDSLFKETGSVYIFPSSQIEKRHLTDGKRKLLMDPYDFDIDTYDDLKRANQFLNDQKNKTGEV
jgi:CMP-N-acetylneuraminic acid synthetase